VKKLLDVQGVIDIREMVTGKRNIQTEVVGRDPSDIVRNTDPIHDIGVEVESSEILKGRRIQPFNHIYFSEAARDTDRHGDASEDE
jgi:hypothetical protein